MPVPDFDFVAAADVEHGPQHAAVERAADKKLRPYLRDVRDHLLLVDEEVAAQRDLLGTVLEANMAVISVEQNKISVRQNTTIEQLTILATVFLALQLTMLEPSLLMLARMRARTRETSSWSGRLTPREKEFSVHVMERFE